MRKLCVLLGVLSGCAGDPSIAEVGEPLGTKGYGLTLQPGAHKAIVVTDGLHGCAAADTAGHYEYKYTLTQALVDDINTVLASSTGEARVDVSYQGWIYGTGAYHSFGTARVLLDGTQACDGTFDVSGADQFPLLSQSDTLSCHISTIHAATLHAGSVIDVLVDGSATGDVLTSCGSICGGEAMFRGKSATLWIVP